MTRGKCLLTVDWVVKQIIFFNQAQFKDKSMMHKLRYIFKLAATRGCEGSIEIFKQLCNSTIAVDKIQKDVKKICTYVSPDEIKVVIVADKAI